MSGYGVGPLAEVGTKDLVDELARRYDVGVVLLSRTARRDAATASYRRDWGDPFGVLGHLDAYRDVLLDELRDKRIIGRGPELEEDDGA